MGETGEVRSGAAHCGGALLHRIGASRSRHDHAVRRDGARRAQRPAGQGPHLPRASSSSRTMDDQRQRRTFREAFKLFAARGRRQGLAVVISDFLDPNGYESASEGLAGAWATTSTSFIWRQRRIGIPARLGDVKFVDAETLRGARRGSDAGPGGRVSQGVGARTPRNWQHSAAATTSDTSGQTPNGRLKRSFCRRSGRDGSSHEFWRDGGMAGLGPAGAHCGRRCRGSSS